MSNQMSGVGRGRGAQPTLPTGEKVASYSAYAQALEALDKLVKADFPVAEVSIVGSDLVTVERVTGRMSYAKAAGRGAMTGAWFGLFLMLLITINPVAAANPTFAFAPILIGAGLGMIIGMVLYSFSRKRKDFTSVSQVMASRYTLVISGPHANRAKNILDIGFGAPLAVPPVPPAPSAPPAPPAAEEPSLAEGEPVSAGKGGAGKSGSETP